MLARRILSSLLVASLAGFVAAQGLANRPGGHVAVANRASGTLSILHAGTHAVVATVDLPAGTRRPEPMYVVSGWSGRVFVGDRANDRVVVFRAADWSVEATVPAGAGVFHMWSDALDRWLWVNNDIDNTGTLIDARELTVVATVPMPADLVSQGGRPHDVVLDPQGTAAFVSLVGVAGPQDYVVRFDLDSLHETARAAVGKDPHLSLTRRNQLLYVPSQNGNAVHVLRRADLAPVTTIPVPGAHGAGMVQNGRWLYTTNLPGGGSNALFTIDTHDQTLVGTPVAAPFPVPHNIALTPDGRTLFVTHSGLAASKVSIYRTLPNDPRPVLAGSVTVGFNPFGLAYVP